MIPGDLGGSNVIARVIIKGGSRVGGRGEDAVMKDVEIRVIWSLAKECQRPLEGRKDKEQSLPWSLRKEPALLTP